MNRERVPRHLKNGELATMPGLLIERYRELQQYVGWTDGDATRVRALAPLIVPHIGELIDDFYQEIKRHPHASKVITGGEAQIQRLKQTLAGWLKELLGGKYDAEYVLHRRRIGDRHVEIGLDQIYTNAALSRLRSRMAELAGRAWCDLDVKSGVAPRGDLATSIKSLNLLLDLDLAIIQDAYQTAHARRQLEVEQLVQAARLAALNEAMASLVHESRNALQRSQAGLEMLARKVRDQPDAVSQILRIQEAQDDLHGLYEEVREYAAPLKLRMEPCDPVAVLHEAWDHLAAQRQSRDASLQVHVDSAGAKCECDRVALRRVFRNLFENSLAACSDPVRLTAAIQPMVNGVESSVAINLRDSGPGFLPDQQSRLFEPFYTTKTHGTGLGMAICKRIIEAHGGTISIGPGPGAEIIMTLPLKLAERRL